MPLSAYIDDSGSDPTDPIFVLAGFVLPDSWWKRVSEDWVAVLHTEPKIEYFKASEVWDRRKGQFALMTDAERRQKVDALVDVAMEYHPYGIACRVRWSCFNKFLAANPVHPLARNPYFFLFYGLIAALAHVQREEHRFDTVQFYFENQGKLGEDCKKFYGYFKQQAHPDLKRFLGDAPEFGDEKIDYPLQCADLFAWYTRRNDLKTLGSEWHQSVWTRLSKNYIAKGMSPASLKQMAWELGAIP